MGPWESHLLWGLENILSSHGRDDGPLVCFVRLQRKGQASHQLHTQLCDGDTVIQDDNCLLSQDGVGERREDLRKQGRKRVTSPQRTTFQLLSREGHQ